MQLKVHIVDISVAISFVVIKVNFKNLSPFPRRHFTQTHILNTLLYKGTLSQNAWVCQKN